MIDTHAHLNYPDIQKNLPDILKRAEDNGISKIIIPATDIKSSREIIELIEKHDMLYGAVGIHPTELKDFNENDLNEIEELCISNKIAAIGEIGLDYYWKPYDKALEQHVLKSQLQIAKRNNLPVILHNRESSEDLMQLIIDEYENGKLKGQFHSFSGDLQIAKKCIEMGFYISFTGNLTYKPNEKTLTAIEIVKNIPLEHFLLETDTPYLPPVPYRGKQNEPSYVIHTAQKIAELKNTTIEEVGRVTSLNAERLYKI
ncbi:MAG: TatD family deoxyribonuclease [Ignavibacteriae bacterium]|nr:MAG: TatD family deoxyribonuclease [Ignavibacteriota bacterium]